MLEITAEMVKDVPGTDEIRNHFMYLPFIKWLGDNYVPLNANYPLLWLYFREHCNDRH